MPRRSQLSQKTLNKLKKANWSEWVKAFNQVHNSTMFTAIGKIKIEIDDQKKNSYTKKSKSRDR